MQILTIIFPVFGVILSGYLLKSLKIVRASWISDLNSFTYFVALPAIIVNIISKADWTNGLLLQTAAINILALVLFGGLLTILLNFFLTNTRLKGAVLLTSAVGNTIYMGLPIARPLFSGTAESMVYAAAAAQLVFGIAFGLLAAERWTSGKVRIKKYFRDFFSSPLILALGFGVLFSFAPKDNLIFEILDKSIVMLAATASPLALFALGAFFHGKFSKVSPTLVAVSAILKLVALPALMLLVFKILPEAEPEAAQASALMAAMPAAATTFVLAEKFGLNKDFTADSMLVSTALSFFSISLILLYFL